MLGKDLGRTAFFKSFIWAVVFGILTLPVEVWYFPWTLKHKDLTAMCFVGWILLNTFVVNPWLDTMYQKIRRTIGEFCEKRYARIPVPQNEESEVD